MSSAADFDLIVDSIRAEMPDFPNQKEGGPLMPDLTPGEGGAFALAALLLTAGLVADLSENVQLATIIGAVLLGIAGTLTTGTIRRARNFRVAAEAEALGFAIIATDDDEGEVG
jgi:hypothetical protein